jgi:putative transposase
MHGRSGHLWQNRFYSCGLDDEHFFQAVKYVERNPVRAKIVRVPWRYRWSSAAAHIKSIDKSGLLDMEWWQKHYETGEAWREEVTEPQNEKAISLIRFHLNRGRPLASDSFMSKLEKMLGRRLRALPVGRPKKKAKKKRKKKARKSKRRKINR